MKGVLPVPRTTGPPSARQPVVAWNGDKKTSELKLCMCRRQHADAPGHGRSVRPTRASRRSRTSPYAADERDRICVRPACSNRCGMNMLLRLVLQPSGLLCILKPGFRLDLEVSVVGMDRHEKVMQEAF